MLGVGEAGMSSDDIDQIFDEIALEQAWPFLLLENCGLATHLSYTSVTMHMRCPESSRRRYVLGEKERPGAALILGGADHQAHEVNYRQKIDTHEDMPTREIQEVFADTYDRKIQQAGGMAEIAWGKDKPGELKDLGVKLVTTYHETISRLVQPVQVEREITHFVPGVPVPIVGFVDVETERSLIERKTAAKAERKPKPEWLIQGRIYRQAVGKPVQWHVVNKSRGEILTSRTDPELQLPAVEGDQGIDDLIRYVAADMVANLQRYGPDNPWPGATTHPWACGFCGYRPTCHWWEHERKVAA